MGERGTLDAIKGRRRDSATRRPLTPPWRGERRHFPSRAAMEATDNEKKAAFRFRHVAINHYGANDNPFETNPTQLTKTRDDVNTNPNSPTANQTNESQTQTPIEVATEKKF